MSFLHGHHDDSSSGAGKYGLVALVVLIASGGAAYWFFGRAPEPEPEPVAEAPPPVVEEREPLAIPPKADIPSTGTLRVSAGVDGAIVYVNGTQVGPAPYEDRAIRVGEHEVKVSKKATRTMSRSRA